VSQVPRIDKLEPQGRASLLEALLCCPACRGPLAWEETRVACEDCGKAYGFTRGRPDFADNEFPQTADAIFQQQQMHQSSFTARCFDLGSRIVNSDYTPVDQLAAFLRDIPEDAVVMELGSGRRRLREQVITVDLFPFPNVDVLADIRQAPFVEGCADFVVLDTVLEHVPEPQAVVDEIRRILKPGGKVLCVSPFIFPYHGYPAHYCNFSKDGLEHLFRHYSECCVSMNIGPTSAMTNLFSEYFALAFSRGNKFAYTLLKGLFLLPVFYLKYLDRLWSGTAQADRIASMLCTIAVK
jgi:SAM-dependent methyltransferase/uncharacterized protein YbaR (Trm112 family)